MLLFLGQYELMDLLIQIGGDVNIRDNDQHTPLHLAAKHGYDQIVRLLLQKGSDIEAKNKVGHTPIMDASENGESSKKLLSV